METKEILFLLITTVLIFHEIRKIKDSEYIFEASREIRKRIKEGLSNNLKEFPRYESVLFWDILELIFLIFGLLSPQWYLYLAIIVLSWSAIQKINIYFFRIDAIITILIFILTVLDRFFIINH